MDHGISSPLPEILPELLARSYDPATVERILSDYPAKRPVTIRSNGLKTTESAVAAALEENAIGFGKVDWYEEAFIIEGLREEAIRELPLYDDGEIYLQSLSAMMPALVLDGAPGDDILDMCAAPGGKTTQIAALTKGRAFLTACEMSAPRAEKLRFNLERQGARNVTVLRTDSRNLDDFFSFDRVLVDAPCSGSGTLLSGNRKSPDRFTDHLVKKSVRAQRVLLAKGLSLLRPGGQLVYATCSILKEENEAIVEEALTKGGERFQLVPVVLEGLDKGFLLPSTLEGTLTLRPSELYEGFFIARIKRVR